MRIDIITLFPEFFTGLMSHSIIGRAIASGKVEIVPHNLRDYAQDKYKSVDDRPYGGGPGMVLRVDIMVAAINAVKESNPDAPIILMTPQGNPYRQGSAATFARAGGLILICGHYEGYDERIRSYVTHEISIGDYVLTGGELPAMVVVDSIVRLLPGVLGDDASSHEESFSPASESGDILLEYPHYTRPETYDGKKVPEVLLSGNHKVIADWRHTQAREKTEKRRPDLLSG